MREKPILFSAPMVQAILAGTKTQTRRVVKPQPIDSDGQIYDGKMYGPEMYEPCTYDKHGEMVPGKEIFGIYTEDGEFGIKFPYGEIGDQLWVRETWGYNPDFPNRLESVCYRADAEHKYDGIKWKPSIHMPRKASRIQLEITSVRVERLNEISEADAIAEGIERVGGNASITPWRNYRLGQEGEMQQHCSAPTRSYMTLWESINGAGSWAANPWVWVLEFKVIKP